MMMVIRSHLAERSVTNETNVPGEAVNAQITAAKACTFPTFSL